MPADFSAEILKARREWHDVFKVLKRKNLQPKILYPARLPFRIEIEKEIVLQTNFLLKEFMTTKWFLQEMLKGFL